MTAFAGVDDVLVTRRQGTTDDRYLAAVTRYLEDASQDITEGVGYSFARQPETGIETWITNGTGCHVLHVHEGLAQLDLVEIRFWPTDSWIPLASTDWVLEYEVGDPRIPDGEPAYHVVLLPSASYLSFPKGRQLVRLTGARGWPSIPTRARSMTVAIVRQRLGLDQSGQGGTFGPDEFGGRVGVDLWPKAAYDTLMLERRRHQACSM